MARRRHQEDHENHERWLVSYADFITLLFAFFVVMYSISSINEGKYKVLSQALVGVFNDPDHSTRPIPIGQEAPQGQKTAVPIIDNGEQTQSGVGAASVDPLKEIAESVQQAFGDLIKSNQLTVRGNEQWIEIELNSSLLFTSGDAVPSNQAFDIIDKVGKILGRFDNPVHVEGFTDNQPIKTALYPTNWELSSARASSIVRMLATDGLNPGRLASVGYAEFQPVADNATAEGRARNRRVVLVISRNLEVRRSLTSTGATPAAPTAATIKAGGAAASGVPVSGTPANNSSAAPAGTQSAPGNTTQP